jgi:hypothetical protein
MVGMELVYKSSGIFQSMSDEAQSAEELFELLAGDDDEVPASLLRGSKSLTRHEEAMIEQARLGQLNKVEKWMSQDGALESDPIEFISLGETIYDALLKSKKSELTLSLTQKLTKLANLWLKVSKSCKLLESHLRPSHISRLLERLIKSPSAPVSIQGICGRLLVAMVQSSPRRLFSDNEVVEAFNNFVLAWCKGKFKGNGLTVLNLFPIEFLAQLSWPFSSKPFVAGKLNDVIVRLIKKGIKPHLDQANYLSCLRTVDAGQKKDLEEHFIKLMGAFARSKTVSVSADVHEWLKQVAARDIKQPGISAKNVRLASEVLKQLEK